MACLYRCRVLQPSDPQPVRPLCVLVISILILIILVLVAILVTWLVLRPVPLEFTVEDAHVHGFYITNNALDTTFDFILRAGNPNLKVSIYYDSVEVTVWYSDQMVAVCDVAPFYLPRLNATRLDVVAEARSMRLAKSAASSLKHARSAGKAVFEVTVRARIRFRVGPAKTKHYTLKIDCPSVVVYFSSSAPFDRTFCDADISN